jgi:hypothetical protein
MVPSKGKECLLVSSRWIGGRGYRWGYSLRWEWCWLLGAWMALRTWRSSLCWSWIWIVGWGTHRGTTIGLRGHFGRTRSNFRNRFRGHPRLRSRLRQYPLAQRMAGISHVISPLITTWFPLVQSRAWFRGLFRVRAEFHGALHVPFTRIFSIHPLTASSFRGMIKLTFSLFLLLLSLVLLPQLIQMLLQTQPHKLTGSVL